MAEAAQLKKTVKLFDLHAGADRLYRLKYPSRWLVPVDTSADEENAVFLFDIKELEPALSLRKAPLVDRLRFLANTAGLFEAHAEYAFDLSPENLYADRNLEPKIVMRDLAGEPQDGPDFTEQYRALAGTLLAPRYSYEDYLRGGAGLYKKKRRLKKLPLLHSVDELERFFQDQYTAELQRLRRTKAYVNRRRYRVLMILTPLFALLFALSGVAAWYLYTRELPFQQTLLAAEHSFVREDYDGAIDALREVEPADIPKEERFQLARAYVISESLSQEQKRNILSGLTLQTEDNLLLYWIQLGRIEYAAAIDTAQRIGDDELLLYALVKYEVAVQADNTMTGEEKVNLISSLDQQIEALRKKQEEKEQTLAEAAQPVEQKPEPAPAVEESRPQDVASGDGAQGLLPDGDGAGGEAAP